MKIIADTNVWYALGQDEDLFLRVKHLPISPTLLCMLELVSSSLLLEDKRILIRNAIRKMTSFKDHLIMWPPLAHLASLRYNAEINVNIESNQLIQIMEDIANDKELQPQYIDVFKRFRDQVRQPGIEFGQLMTNNAKKYKTPEQKRELKNSDTLDSTYLFLNDYVLHAMKGKFSLIGTEKNKFELVAKTLDQFLRSLTITNRVMHPNDSVDIFNMCYVKPGDFYWTYEEKWNRFIREAKCEEYIFQIP